MVSKPDATASPATLLTLTAAPESASVLVTTVAGLAVVDVCSASPAPALDSAGPKLAELNDVTALFSLFSCTRLMGIFGLLGT